eukprot:CAMPEP_0114972048 /NCGR_PEP_ID=MMETSP0216-20121206/178_1 /TAXON_ID=223996 /ORGANISM="Protocruzia adherens, Strain Boccale" /LENGTH=530 /DNA_ID=CAMNT_0002332377 /DNA_START=35 /DNA_END=1627 /DNA_ORIENTATION=+
MDQSRDSFSKGDVSQHSVVDADEEERSGLSEFAVFAMATNLTIGAGFLAQPYHLLNTGWLLGIVGAVLSFVFTTLTNTFLIDSVAKTQYLHTHERPIRKFNSTMFFSHDYSPARHQPEAAGDEDENRPLQSASISEQDNDDDANRSPFPHDLRIKSTPRIQIFELFYIYLPTNLYKATMMCQFIGVTCLLWAYTLVFATSVTDTIATKFHDHDCDDDYYGDSWCRNCFNVVVGVFVIYSNLCSLLGLKEQKVFQIVMALCRFFLVFLMMTTALVEYFQHTEETGGDVPAVEFSNFPLYLSTTLMAVGSQPALPTLITNARKKETTDFNWLFVKINIVACTLLYLLPLSVALGYGDETDEMAPLSWKFYNINGGAWKPLQEFISCFILLFPAVDMLSSFPLWATTWSESTALLWQKMDREEQPQEFDQMSEEEYHADYERRRRIMTLAVTIPGSIFGILIRQAEEIITATSLMASLINYTFVTLIYLAVEDNFKQETAYKTGFKGRRYADITVVFGIFAFIAGVYAFATED